MNETELSDVTPETPKVTVTLFKPSGKYYTTEEWEIPTGIIGPYDMNKSPDFRRISGGHVLIEAQEPWGYPHLFPATTVVLYPGGSVTVERNDA